MDGLMERWMGSLMYYHVILYTLNPKQFFSTVCGGRGVNWFMAVCNYSAKNRLWLLLTNCHRTFSKNDFTFFFARVPFVVFICSTRLWAAFGRQSLGWIFERWPVLSPGWAPRLAHLPTSRYSGILFFFVFLIQTPEQQGTLNHFEVPFCVDHYTI